MKWLSILALLVVAIPAHGTITLKDWEKKSGEDQIYYLGVCVVSLTAEVAKTDPPLALKIKNYYSEKVPGLKYPEGTTELFTRIIKLEQQAKEGKADLSKIKVEDIVYRVTADKFKLPPREAPQNLGDFKDAAPADHTAPSSTAIMVGKIDVSHFAGLKPGDMPARVASLYGKAAKDYDGGQKGFGTGLLIVRYTDGVVKRVGVASSDLALARSHAGNDALLDLFGHTEADAIALLGPPTTREEMDAPTHYLYWAFPMNGHPVERYINAASTQTLEIDFRPGTGCYRIGVTW